jgi:uncharacterized protein with HEPN domain
MPRDWRMRIEDILEAVERIARYIAGLDFEGFVEDQRTVGAVIRNLEVIGEAARAIDETITKQYADVPWSEMRGIRNVLAHEYFGVDAAIVWKTATAELPPLVPALRAIVCRE